MSLHLSVIVFIYKGKLLGKRLAENGIPGKAVLDKRQADRLGIVGPGWVTSSLACGVAELGIYTAGGYRHDNGFCSTDFIVADSVFLSIAKAVSHSGIAAKGHGRCKIKQAGGFRIQDVILPYGL